MTACRDFKGEPGGQIQRTHIYQRSAGARFHAIASYLRALANLQLVEGWSAYAGPVLLLGSLAIFLQWKCEAMERFTPWRTHWQTLAVVGALATIAALGVFKGAQWIWQNERSVVPNCTARVLKVAFNTVLSSLRSLADHHSNLVLLENLPPQPPPDYEDLTHVNKPAQERFTRFLAERLRAFPDRDSNPQR